MTWDAWLFTIVGLALALTPIALTAMAAARFGAHSAWLFGIGLYGLPLLIGFVAMSLSAKETVGPIGDGVLAVFISAAVLQIAAALMLRFVKPRAPR